MPDLDRRRFLVAAAATVASSELRLLAFSRRLEAMTQPATEVSVAWEQPEYFVTAMRDGFRSVRGSATTVGRAD
jgi:hypothetical protein